MLVFGGSASILRELKVNMAPLRLGLVLGDRLEKFDARLGASSSSLLSFFTRPTCALFSALTVFLIVPGVKASTRTVLRRTLAGWR
jgi:TctA family transporter